VPQRVSLAVVDVQIRRADLGRGRSMVDGVQDGSAPIHF
jgi:hypothetical protein